MKAMPQFHAIGSDPEFVFVEQIEQTPPTLISAATVISRNKVAALQSFIGTDGHAATAELRPGPAHNIGRHLYDIAYGLHETDSWLTQQKKYTHTKIISQPYVYGEPLGGHIHCSFFLDEPETRILRALNRTYNAGLYSIYDTAQINPIPTQDQTRDLINYVNKYREGLLFTMADFERVMDFVLWPFECAIQPWQNRQCRNDRYGGTDGAGARVRQQVSYPQIASKYNRLAYMHLEYRVPSTWLCHPWLAYAYLGLAKLAILNAKSILELKAVSRSIRYPLGTTAPGNAQYQKRFNSRFKFLTQTGRWTNDIRGLIDIIPKCFNMRQMWFETIGQPIDIDAWRKLL